VLTFTQKPVLYFAVSNVELTKSEWKRILAYLQTRSDLYIAKPSRCKRFVEAVLWMTRSGAQWRLLPKKYGDWNSVFKRFDRWAEKGIWRDMFEHFAKDADMESLMIDATVVRAHSAAGVKGGIKRKKHLDAAKGDSLLKSMLP
jgi:transposase